jgi:unsaturated pyranuronate lyase
MTVANWDVKEGFSLPKHSHLNEQVSQVTLGKFELTVDGETIIMTPGTVVVIPPDAIHHGIAISDCKIVDFFSPVREDYKKLD